MSIFTRTPVVRWVVPVIAAAGLVGGSIAVDGLSASAQEGLRPRTAAQLLVDVQKARLDGVSGTIVQKAELGLPDLPGAGGAGSSDLSSLVSGSHTLRLWYGGPDRVRLALLGRLGESDIIRNGDDLWTWSSNDKSATHRTLGHEAGHRPGHGQVGTPAPSELPQTPQQAAAEVLERLGPTTKVSADATATVAHRAAYELVLRPRDTATLVDRVSIAIDGTTHVPLRVRAYAKGIDAPAFEVGFTSFDPTRPDAAQFRFNPPPGTTVTEDKGGSPAAAKGTRARDHGRSALAHQARTAHVVGDGWTAVLVSGPSKPGSPAAGDGPAGGLEQVLRSLPRVSGTWGSGRLLSGTLFSAVLTDDGRLAVGAVTPQALYAALAAR